MSEPKVSLEAQIAAAARELAMRRNVYPKWVAGGRMSKAKSDAEIAAMEATVETLRAHQRTENALRVANAALIAAADQFAFYEQQHRAKGTADGEAKAAVNARMAEVCRAAASGTNVTQPGENTRSASPEPVAP